MDSDAGPGDNRRATRSDPFNLGYSIYQPGRKISGDKFSIELEPIDRHDDESIGKRNDVKPSDPNNRMFSAPNKTKLSQNRNGKVNTFGIGNEDTIRQNEEDDTSIRSEQMDFQRKKRENSDRFNFVSRDNRLGFHSGSKVMALPRPHSAAMDMRFARYGYMKDDDVESINVTKETQDAVGGCCYFVTIFLITILLLSIVASIVIVVIGNQAQNTSGSYEVLVNATVTAQYIPEYGNKDSKEFKTFSTLFCSSIQEKMMSPRAIHGSQYRGCEVDTIRNGSCIVRFRLFYTAKQKVGAESIEKDFNITHTTQPFSFLSFIVIEIFKKQQAPSTTFITSTGEISPSQITESCSTGYSCNSLVLTTDTWSVLPSVTADFTRDSSYPTLSVFSETSWSSTGMISSRIDTISSTLYSSKSLSETLIKSSMTPDVTAVSTADSLKESTTKTITNTVDSIVTSIPDIASGTENSIASVTSTTQDMRTDVNNSMTSMPSTIRNMESEIDTSRSMTLVPQSVLEPSSAVTFFSAAASTEQSSENFLDMTNSVIQSDYSPISTTAVSIPPSVTASTLQDAFAKMENEYIFEVNKTSTFYCDVEIRSTSSVNITTMRIVRSNVNGSNSYTVITHNFNRNVTTSDDMAFTILEIEKNGSVTKVTFGYDTNSVSNPDVCSVPGKYTCDFDVSDLELRKDPATTRLGLTGKPSNVAISTDNQYQVNTTGTVNCTANLDIINGIYFITLFLSNGSDPISFSEIMEASNNTGRISGFPTVTLRDEVINGQSDDCLTSKTKIYNVLFDVDMEYNSLVSCGVVDFKNDTLYSIDPVLLNVTST